LPELHCPHSCHSGRAREMLEAGELTAMFDEKGVAYDKSKLLA
jgi:hypothetical protein